MSYQVSVFCGNCYENVVNVTTDPMNERDTARNALEDGLLARPSATSILVRDHEGEEIEITRKGAWWGINLHGRRVRIAEHADVMQMVAETLREQLDELNA